MSAVNYALYLFVLLMCLKCLTATLVDYHNEINKGGYYFRFKTDNGIERHEEGKLKETPTGNVISVAGSYQFEVDGVITIVTFIADEKGFRPISQLRKKVNNQLPVGFTLDNRIDPKLLGSLAGGGLG